MKNGSKVFAVVVGSFIAAAVMVACGNFSAVDIKTKIDGTTVEVGYATNGSTVINVDDGKHK